MKWFLVWVAISPQGTDLVTVDEHPFYSYEACQAEQQAAYRDREHQLPPGVKVFCGGNQVALSVLTKMMEEKVRQ